MTLAAHAVVPIVMIHVQGDDGTALIFGMIFLAMSYIAGVQLRYFLILGGLLLAGIPVIWHFYMNEEHRNRIRALFDLDGNAMTNYGWQQYQGKVSIAGGELTGSGLYHGPRVEYAIVPEQENDFILAVAGEETGFIGAAALLIAYMVLLYTILRSGFWAPDSFARQSSIGIAVLIFVHLFINIGMSVGVTPITGLPLPFLSYGGSFVVSMMLAGCA